jgi:hypothetical protein
MDKVQIKQWSLALNTFSFSDKISLTQQWWIRRRLALEAHGVEIFDIYETALFNRMWHLLAFYLKYLPRILIFAKTAIINKPFQYDKNYFNKILHNKKKSLLFRAE